MKILTSKEIRQVKNSFTALNEFGVEMKLLNILNQELNQGFPSDINNSF